MTGTVHKANVNNTVVDHVEDPGMDLCINNFGVDNGVSEGELMDKEADEPGQSRRPPWEEYWDSRTEDELEAIDHEIERKKRVRFALVAVNWMSQKIDEEERDLRCCAVVTAEDHAQPTLSDSGSNIDIITKETAALLELKYGFVYYPVPSGIASQYVMFGRKDARAKIIGFMYGCGLLGQVAVVEDVGVNLISVKNLCQKRLTVSYTDSEVLVLSVEGTLVHRGSFDEGMQLWKFDIVSLMLQETSSDMESDVPKQSFSYLALWSS
jgi:hypothetical protein